MNKKNLKILFIQEIWYWQMGVMYLSAIAKQMGHDVFLLLQESPKKMLRKIIQYDPDIIAFSVLSGSHLYVEKWAPILKKHTRALIIAGNVHTTVLPEFIHKPGIDVICRGEGEIAFKEILMRLEGSEELDKIDNLWIKKPNGEIIKSEIIQCVLDLDSIPFADRKLYNHYAFFRSKHQASLTSNRGCPYRCTFCLSPQFRHSHFGQRKIFIRKRSVDSLIEEAKLVVKEINPSIIHFHDDVFILDKAWLAEFAEKWSREINIPYYCGARSDNIDEDRAYLLSKSQCRLFFMGVESGDETIRNKMLAKNITDAQLFDAAALLKKHHIALQTQNMINLPGETLAEFQKTLDINFKIKPDTAVCTIYTPYPGSKLTKYCLRNGFIDEDYVDKIPPTYYQKSILNPEKQKDIYLLNKLQKVFSLMVKLPFLSKPMIGLAKILPHFFFDILFLFSEVVRLVIFHRLSMKDVLYTGMKTLNMYRGKNFKALHR